MEHERPMILAKAHEGISRGNYIGKSIMQKVLHKGLWWPTLHKDSEEYFQRYDVFQRVGNPSMRDEIPLRWYVTLQVFDK